MDGQLLQERQFVQSVQPVQSLQDSLSSLSGMILEWVEVGFGGDETSESLQMEVIKG